MTVSDLIEILSGVNPKSRIVLLAGGVDVEVAEEVVAVATPDQLWVRSGNADKELELGTPQSDKQPKDCEDHRATGESETVSVVILAADEDFLFKAILRKLMSG